MKSGFLLRCILVSLLVMPLIACHGSTAEIGSTVKGTRIALLKNNKTLEPDSDLRDLKPELSEPISNHNWLLAGYDSSHVLPNVNVNVHPTEIWRANIGSGSNSDFKLLARPVIADGRIFTMDAEGLVKAINMKTGEQLWVFDTTPEERDEKTIGGGLGIEGDTVYATTGFGEVLALKCADGSLRWRRLLLNPLRAAPTIMAGRVYVVSIDNELQALNVRNGETLWHHNGISESATLMGASSPAVIGDSVIVAYSSGEIFNLRAENGRVSWNYALTAPTKVGALPAIADIRGLPVVDNGRVFAISHNGRMGAIEQRTGDRAWEADIGGVNTPVVSGEMVFALTNEGQIIAVMRQSGRILWVHDLQHLEDPEDHDSQPVFWTGPVLGGGRLWLTNSLGQLVSFSSTDGSSGDTIDIGNAAYIPPVIADNTFYIVTDDGYLVALH